MAKVLQINHATIVVDDLERARAFYERELGLEALPTFNLDFPAQFYRINATQQLHVTEWPDTPSFRGHVCLQVDDFNAVFFRMRELGVIDTSPWGKVRRLPDGAMQMFVRDPAGNLVEISCHPATPIDDAIFEDAELVQPGVGAFVSGRGDARGTRGEDATLYHGDGQA
jgi:catechol 2,3-dioxygenase-like lactoylglutathione lyase family enzyme